jgi:putative transposase
MRMPRQPRIAFPGLPQHLIVRGNDRRAIFFCDRDRSCFLKHLGEASTERACDVHAFVLMDNHVHVLATANDAGGLSKMMQDVGRSYVKYINSTYKRTGTLYEGRFKSSLVETSRYFLACMRYIELNPVRAGLAGMPGDFPWSSFGQNATGEPMGLVTAHPEYLALGVDAASRSDAYLRLFDEPVDDVELSAIRTSVRQGRALGSALFCQALQATLGRHVSTAPRGRPGRRS